MLRLLTTVLLVAFLAVAGMSPAGPVLAQDSGTVEVSVDCGGDGETVQVTNNATFTLTLREVASISLGFGSAIAIQPPEVLGPGETATYYFGVRMAGAAGHVLSSKPIFDESRADEGVGVFTHDLEYLATCAQGTATLDALTGDAVTDAEQTPESDGQVRTTYRLTLNGDVPDEETFGVEIYDDGTDFPTAVLLLCGDAPPTQLDSIPDCAGGTTYSQAYPFPPETFVRAVIYRQASKSHDIEVVSETKGVVGADSVLSTEYTFPTTATGGEIPSQLPETGEGGLSSRDRQAPVPS